MIDRAAGGEVAGSRLLDFSGSVFDWWGRHQSGSIRRRTLRGYAAGLRPVDRTLLEQGVGCSCPWTAKVCRRLLAGERCHGLPPSPP